MDMSHLEASARREPGSVARLSSAGLVLLKQGGVR
jgi:hypothetical protein